MENCKCLKLKIKQKVSVQDLRSVMIEINEKGIRAHCSVTV